MQSSPRIFETLCSTVSRLAIDDDVGIFGRFVRIGDAGKVLELAGDRFFVESLDVAAYEFVERAADVDLDELRLADALAGLGCAPARTARSLR